MNRLTYKSRMGDYGSNVSYDSVYSEIAALRNRLGKYEDTGLEPEEIDAPAEECVSDFIEKSKKYEIPPEIEVKIPSYFIAAFAGELVSVFGADVVLKDSDGDYNVWWNTGTFGFRDAFYAACKKLKLGWLHEYRDLLEWYESDEFDNIICERVCDFLDGNQVSSMAYCNYIKESEKDNETKD